METKIDDDEILVYRNLFEDLREECEVLRANYEYLQEENALLAKQLFQAKADESAPKFLEFYGGQ